MSDHLTAAEMGAFTARLRNRVFEKMYKPYIENVISTVKEITGTDEFKEFIRKRKLSGKPKTGIQLVIFKKGKYIKFIP